MNPGEMGYGGVEWIDVAQYITLLVLVVPKSNRRAEMKQLLTHNNSAKNSPHNINAIPNENKPAHSNNHPDISDSGGPRRNKSNIITKNLNILIN
jgi:hypothetical protein